VRFAGALAVRSQPLLPTSAVVRSVGQHSSLISNIPYLQRLRHRDELRAFMIRIEQNRETAGQEYQDLNNALALIFMSNHTDSDIVFMFIQLNSRNAMTKGLLMKDGMILRMEAVQ